MIITQSSIQIIDNIPFDKIIVSKQLLTPVRLVRNFKMADYKSKFIYLSWLVPFVMLIDSHAHVDLRIINRGVKRLLKREDLVTKVEDKLR